MKSPNCFKTIHISSLFLGLIFSPFYVFAYQIEGKVSLPENDDWTPIVYLSLINSFDDLNAVSEDFIINKSEIQPDGYFILSGTNIPESDRIYRLHICQKGDPIATIMIGGKEENHCHLLMNKNSNLHFESNDLLFSSFRISKNESFDQIKEWLVFRKKSPKVNSKTNREFRQKEFENALLNFADTCQNSALSLLALHYLDYENHLSKQPNFYQKLFAKWDTDNEKSPYFLEFKQRLQLHEILQEPSSSISTFWVLVIVIVGWISFYLFQYQSSKNQTISKEKIAHLSNQERRVFDLLKTGKTNKEISNELNIGLSTVKSHVYKIYSKLGIKSRKEVRIL